jgi:GGDEF domain-containing protein
VLALDLNHFKKFNETFGHIAGDLVPREWGARLSQTPRHGRAHERKRVHYSLTDTDPSGVARRCAHANGKHIELTISVGAVSSTGMPAEAAMSLKERADEALKDVSALLADSKLPRLSGSRHAATLT